MANLKIFPQKVLDCGQIKILDEINMKPNYIYEFENKILDAIKIKEKFFHDPKNREYSRNYEALKNDDFLWKWVADWEFGFRPKLNSQSIAKYMGVEPFHDCVMINISPNWKGKFSESDLIDKLMIKKFKIVIENYLKSCDRWSKWKYVLECGGDGNFLHAHIVAEINPKQKKSVNSHINKGNHTLEIRKIWDKTFRKSAEGYVGALKGKFAVQRIMLRTETLRDDKLKYLIESEKPEGHKNDRDLGILENQGF